eukprot:7401939-Alexandrium_andersonii.AAC.1
MCPACPKGLSRACDMLKGSNIKPSLLLQPTGQGWHLLWRAVQVTNYDYWRSLQVGALFHDVSNHFRGALNMPASCRSLRPIIQVE